MARRRSDFLNGAARAFDISGALSRGGRRSFEADGWALRSDWRAVGGDIAGVLARRCAPGTSKRDASGIPKGAPRTDEPSWRR